MGKFGHFSPKPHLVWRNDEGLLLLLHNRAGYMSRDEQASKETLVKRYTDKSGVQRRVGIPDKLRASQKLD